MHDIEHSIYIPIYPYTPHCPEMTMPGPHRHRCHHLVVSNCCCSLHYYSSSVVGRMRRRMIHFRRTVHTRLLYSPPDIDTICRLVTPVYVIIPYWLQLLCLLLRWKWKKKRSHSVHHPQTYYSKGMIVGIVGIRNACIALVRPILEIHSYYYSLVIFFQ